MIRSWDALMNNPLLFLHNGIFVSYHGKWTFFFLRLEEENDEYINNYYLLDPPPPGVSLDIIEDARSKRKRNKNLK